MPNGFPGTGIGLPTTVLALPDITDTVLSLRLVTYKLPLEESKLIPVGRVPTGIRLLSTVLV